MSKDRLLRALRCEPVDRIPAWIMRQAGRYLPEYRALRKKAKNFLDFCKTPELAIAATLLPLERYPLDAAIIFSDILVIPEAMNLQLDFKEGQGPIFHQPIVERQTILDLPTISPEHDLAYVLEAIRGVKTQIGDLPLIGFSGSPWTLAVYMLEGQGSKFFAKAKTWLYQDPEALTLLLKKLTQAVSDYLLAQIKAGADVVMLFDSWAGLLDKRLFLTFSLSFMAEIVSKVKKSYPNIPIILFAKNGGVGLEEIVATGCDAIGLDYTADVALAKRIAGTRVALQGNLDPCVLHSDPENIRREVGRVLSSFGDGQGHIFNLGHGIHPDVPPHHVEVLLDAIQGAKLAG